jgi:hypothetical protein
VVRLTDKLRLVDDASILGIGYPVGRRDRWQGLAMLVSDVNSWCDRPDDAQTWRSSSYVRGWMTRNPVRDITRVISQTPAQLILERRPNDVAKTTRRTIFWWFCGVIPMGLVIAVWIYLAYHFCFPDPGKPLVPASILIFATVMTMLNGLAFGTSLLSLAKAKVSTFILDKLAGELTIVMRSMRHEETVTYSLRECQGAIVEAQIVHPDDFSQNGYYKCRIVLGLNSAQSIRLTRSKRLLRVPENSLADTINEFLGVQPSIEG